MVHRCVAVNQQVSKGNDLGYIGDSCCDLRCNLGQLVQSLTEDFKLPFDGRTQLAIGEIVVEGKPAREFQDGVRRLPHIPEVRSRLTTHTSSRATARCRPG